MKAKLTISMINRKTNVVLSKDEVYVNSMKEAIDKVKKLEKSLSKIHFRFSYTLDDIEEDK